MEIIVRFDKSWSGELTASGTENWVKLTGAAIPVGKRFYVGFITIVSVDKNATFELRQNLPGTSLGNTTDTIFKGGYESVNATQDGSKDMDVYWGGSIKYLAPFDADSTGVENLWLRIKSGSNAAATYSYVMYYAEY